MLDWQLRVVEEHDELCERLSRLSAFISDDPTFSALDTPQQHLLRRQRNAMAGYQAVLAARIETF